MRISDWSSDVCSSDLIVVLAMIAGFVALRLVSVLGRRTGHEQPLPQTLDRSASDGMSRQPGGAETQGPASIVPASNIDSKAVEGIRAIIAADPSFDVDRKTAVSGKGLQGRFEHGETRHIKKKTKK